MTGKKFFEKGDLSMKMNEKARFFGIVLVVCAAIFCFSGNAAAGWVKTNFPYDANIMTIVFDKDTNTLYAGTTSYGVFGSSDKGDNWTQLSNGLTLLSYENSVQKLAIDISGTLYAGTRGSGMFRSGDKGENWIQTNNGLTDTFVQAIITDISDTLYIGTRDGGVFRSSNRGDNWTQINKGLTDTNIGSLLIDASGILYAGAWEGSMFSSNDKGDNWSQVSYELTDTYLYQNTYYRCIRHAICRNNKRCVQKQ